MSKTLAYLIEDVRSKVDILFPALLESLNVEPFTTYQNNIAQDTLRKILFRAASEKNQTLLEREAADRSLEEAKKRYKLGLLPSNLFQLFVFK